MKQNDANDPGLDRLLRHYRADVTVDDVSIADMVRAARVRAVGLRQDFDELGFFGMVASVLGFRRATQLMWSTAAGIAVALLLGVSMGAADIFPDTDEQAYMVDFDSVLGTGTIIAGQDLSL